MPAWLLFGLAYTGREEWVDRRVVAALSVVPAATLVAVATNDVHHLVWTDYRVAPTLGAATVAFDPGPWFYLHALYGYLLVGTGVGLIAETLLAHGALYRGQAAALGVGSVVATVAHVKYVLRVGPYPMLHFAPVALAVTGLAFGHAFFRLSSSG